MQASDIKTLALLTYNWLEGVKEDRTWKNYRILMCPEQDEVHEYSGGLCPRHLLGYGLAERVEPVRLGPKGMGYGGNRSCGCAGGHGSVAMVEGEAVKRIPTLAG